jgi:hypothetical protein
MPTARKFSLPFGFSDQNFVCISHFSHVLRDECKGERRNATHTYLIFLKALTVLRGHVAYPNGLLDLHIETFGRTP